MSLIKSDSDRSKAAFGTPLTCPRLVLRNGEQQTCGGQRWTFVEDIGMYRKRYRCKDCNGTCQYDYSAYPDHPYAKMQRQSIYRRLVEQWKRTNAGKVKA